MGFSIENAYMTVMAQHPSNRTVVEVNGKAGRIRPPKARYRTVQRDGEIVKLRVVDADSPNFAADFQAAFAANVRRARRENRALDLD
jgi:hypothetical protein